MDWNWTFFLLFFLLPVACCFAFFVLGAAAGGHEVDWLAALITSLIVGTAFMNVA